MAVISDHCPHLKVTLVDKDKSKIDAWNSIDLSNLPIYEPGLREVIQRNRGKNLFFSINIKKAIEEADMIFISVNTPTKINGLGAGYASDLKWIESSARQVAQYSQGHTIVVEKSTVPVRTAELIQDILLNAENSTYKDKKTFSVISSPEFLAEGTAIKDLENPDRVLIGGADQEAINLLKDIYLRWISEDKILLTNLWSSELSKLIANAFLAQRVSSINSISALCEVTGADIHEVVKAIGSDQRIGSKFLSPSPGFGGSCFKKDILNLVYLCRFYNLEEAANYWEQVLFINDWQKERISSCIIEKFYGTVSNTNDTRESPSIRISKDLLENGARLFINDPKVGKKQIEQELELKEGEIDQLSLGSWTYADNIYHFSKNVDAIVILTEWDSYKELNWERISLNMRKPSWIFDTRNIVSKEDMVKLSINYWQVGITN